ncbi:MAG TPA: HAD-IIIC family phosphatase [Stellaceae bacterium]|nr:HAD-IIIC family phosphatase [Stellaceae bacterium]
MSGTMLRSGEAMQSELEDEADAMFTMPHEDLVRSLFRVLLLRDPADANFPDYALSTRGWSIERMMTAMLRSREFFSKRERFIEEYAREDAIVGDLEYRCPSDLAVTSISLKRVAIIGQCLMDPLQSTLREMWPRCGCDFILFNHVQPLPAQPPVDPSEYDFQLIGLPLRSVLPEVGYFRLSYAEPKAFETLFDECAERLRQFLAAAMQWNTRFGLLTFVANFPVPQQNPMGRLLPRNDLRNFVYFIEKLNEALAEELRGYRNAFLFDLDQIVATYGRRYWQDDAVWITGHNSFLGDGDFILDSERIEPPVLATSVYPSKVRRYRRLIWNELLAMCRTIRQVDMVKLVVLDIDDTLWRGVAAERTEHTPDAVEGWPLGLAEALGHLKRRGALLALISKNEEKLVVPIWEKIYHTRLSLDDFAIRKINWRPKAENFEEILSEANLLPGNVVYIDDNPIERAAIKTAFPDVRTFGSNPLLWRRILLWSPETQVATVTAESAARTEMIRAQVERELQRKRLSREEFLASLEVEMMIREIDAVAHPAFPRALELINKSNQFNTTGRRWTEQEFVAALAGQTRIFVFDVKDKFTAYGIVGVVVCEDARIVQYVMSCRVVGMEVEIAAIADILAIIGGRTRASAVVADLRETDLNHLARDLWKRCGFRQAADGWRRALSPALLRPVHIASSVSASATAAPSREGLNRE